jgi:hypothetical protein
MTAIPDDWLEEVRSGDLSGPPPCDPAAALADVFGRMSDEELSARYRDIEAGLWAWGISYNYVAGSGLIFEWAGYPLLVSDVDLL